MTDLRKAAEMALEALRIQGTPLRRAALSTRTAAIDALRAALEQPDQRISDDPIYIASDGGFYPMPRQRKPLEGEEP